MPFMILTLVPGTDLTGFQVRGTYCLAKKTIIQIQELWGGKTTRNRGLHSTTCREVRSSTRHWLWPEKAMSPLEGPLLTPLPSVWAGSLFELQLLPAQNWKSPEMISETLYFFMATWKWNRDWLATSLEKQSMSLRVHRTHPSPP